MLTATDPLGNTTTNTYDANGNLLSTSAGGNTTGFQYNANGLLTQVTDPRGNPTTFTYTAAGLLATVTDALGNTSTYAYDARGNRTSVTDALNQTTTFTYDVMNRLTVITYPDNTTTAFAYDNRGRRTSVTDATGRVTSYAYDDADRLTSVTDAASNVTSYAYDTENNLTSITDALGRTTSFAYDSLGRVLSTTFPSTLQETYTYDSVGNLLTKTDRKAQTIDYTYDNLNRLARKEYQDTSGVDYSYDDVGRLVQVVDGVNTNYTYDNLSRLLSVLHQLGGNTIDGATYTVDAVGNRTSKLNHLNSETSDYTYDAIYQLTQVVQGMNTTESYSYDEVGNRLSSLGVFPYTYNSSNQLTSTPAVSFTHDENGNTISKTEGTDTTTYAWDYENRMTGMTLPDQSVVSFDYDPFGRRIRKQASSTTVFVYDGANIIEEVDGSGNVLARYTMGLGIDEPLAMLRDTATHYYQADGLGSITALGDSSGTAAANYTYDSFGNLTASTGSLTNRFRYTARELDSETGSYFYRARYLDSSAGRFVSEDPIRFAIQENHQNLFPYVVNNPVRWVDPLGLYKLKKGVPAPSPDLEKLIKCTEDCYGSEITLTSTSEKERPPNRNHARGLATDIGYNSNPGLNSDKLLCCAAKCGAGFGLDELKHPTENTTAPNVHIQIPPGKRGGRGDLPKGKPCECK